MPLYTTDALVLRTYRLGEADRIVVFLTRDRGKKRGVAKGARRTRSRFTGSLEPLTRASVTYFEKERRELVSLNSVDTARSPLQAGNADALMHVGYFADLIDQWAPEADPNERLYRLGAAVIDALTTGAAVQPIARYFEYWLLRLQGVYPAHAACQRCTERFVSSTAILADADRAFLCPRCAPDADCPLLHEEALTFLHAATRATPEEIGRCSLSSAAVEELEVVHRALIATHLEKHLRSGQVVRDISRSENA